MKIGIITHYYRSVNYGGNLQAYSLCRFLNDRGLEAEQISFDREARISFRRNIRQIVDATYLFIKDIPSRISHRKAYSFIRGRNNSFCSFRDMMTPHSKKVYNEKNLSELSHRYDVFVTGSDQVWAPNAVCDAYLLKIGQDGLNKMSYAASITETELPESLKKRFREALKDYKAVSVREEDAIKLIQPLSPVPVRWVMDPVFLLTKDNWNDICTNKTINEEYLFCYFLGDDMRIRKLAGEYAELKKLKIVTIPYMNGKYRECDDNFGDIMMSDVSPQDFVTLIKNASCVFTDSFHAMAFSVIMEKEFFVFDRSSQKSMSSRIRSLSSIFKTDSHYCSDESKMNINYIGEINRLDYSCELPAYETMIAESKDFLLGSILKMTSHSSNG